MIKATKYYIVVFLALLLVPLSGYSQYNGGSGSGAKTDQLGLTSCAVPSQFYAYFGGSGNLIQSDMVNYTSCSTPPPQFFAYMGGTEDGSHVDALTLTSCSTPPQFFAYMGGSADGAHTDALTLTTCSTPSQFFAYMGGAGDGFSRDTFIVCATNPPVANFSVNTTSVCVGNTVTFTDLSTNSPVNWQWTFTGGNPTTSSLQNPSVTYTTPGTYNVKLIATNAFGSNTLTMNGYITVNAIPVADAGSNVSICNGSSTALVASGGTSYMWSPPMGLSSTTIANPVANPTTTTTYTVNVTQNGCSKTDVVTVTVLPYPNANAGSNALLCIGSSTTLGASGGSTYSWTPSYGLNSTTIANPVANPTVTTMYTVTVGNGVCSTQDVMTVSVSPLPVVSAGTNTTICNGGSTTFTASAGTSYTWSPAASLNFSNIASPTASPSTTTNYTVAISNGTCAANAVVSVSVVPLPNANAGSNVAICSGASTTLSASGGTSYSWLPATGLSSATVFNPVANPTTTTVYTVNVTNNGCSKTAAVTVTVNPIPVVNAGADAAICLGSSTVFGASGGTTYSWTPSTGLSSTTVFNPTASPTVTTVYTVTATSGGCSASDVLTLTVNSLPPANAGTDITICSGASTSLSASGGTTYSWLPATGLSSTSIANPVASPASTTNYTVSVSNGTCSANDVVTVSVTPLPNADAGNNVTICNGASTTFSASGGTAYSWAPATALSSTTIANPVANPTVTTDYTVTVTNNGCTATDVINVTVTNALTASAGTSTAICNGSSTILNASGGSTYSWTPSSGLSSTTAPNPSASPSVTTVYTLTAYSGACSASDQVTITVNPVPVATVSASGPTTFCNGNDVVLTASPGSTYLWSNGEATQSVTITTSGNYSVIVSNGSCSANSGITAVTVNTTGIASITPGGPTTFCQGGNVTLTANAGTGYNWSTGAGTQTINVTAGGIYTVTVDDINGCASSTASISITVNPNPATPVITAGGVTSLCFGDNVILSSDAADHYLWSTGAVTQTISVSTAGSYSVTNYNSFGCGTLSPGTNVSVNDPLADFVATPTLVFIPSAVVNFTAMVTGVAPYTYAWEFGDGGTSPLASPSHTYNTVAYRTVTLTVTDDTGCSKTLVKNDYIEVEQLFPSTVMNTGTTIDITGVSFEDGVTGIVSLADGNCLLSVDSGKVWNPLPTGNTEPLTGVYAMPGKWFATGQNGTILLSTNNGGLWTPFTTGTTETFNGSHFSSGNNGFAVGKNGTIHKYDGTGWSPETSGTTEHLNNVFAFSNGNAIAVGDNQTILSYDGTSWTPQTSPLNFQIKDVRFTTLQHGYAAGSNGVILQTTDGGANWLPSLTGVDINFNSVEARGTDTAWAAGSNGIVYKTVDGGSNWIRYSVGYTDDQSQLRMSPGKGHVVGNGGNGKYFDNGDGDIVTSIASGPSPFDNLSVYPNPARDQFTISGFLNSTERVTIDLKDAQAKLVKHITNASFSGQYAESISTEYYSPGIYFIHIQIGNRSMVKKLVIMK